MDMSSEAAAPRTRKPRGQGASRRGEILDAAKRLFVEEGYQNATMRRIAAAVGVSPTALYLHFADKDSILTAIAEDFFSELLVRLEETQTDHTAPLARYRAGIRAYIEFGLDRPDEYRLTFQRRVLHAAPVACTPEPADQSFAILESAVASMVETGIFSPIDPCLAAEAIWCTMHGVTSVLIDIPEKLKCGRDALIDTVVDMVGTGLMAPDSRICGCR
jgi:AcrR family transcriptional regulator